MARVPSLRASDADRENVASRLRHATAEGRLTGDELEERLEALYRSRTYGELDALVADLPVSHSPGRPGTRGARWIGAAGALTLMLALLGMLAAVHRHYATAVTGSGHIRPIRFPGPLAGPHHGLIAAASTAGVLAVVLVGAALVWVFLRSGSTSSDA